MKLPRGGEIALTWSRLADTRLRPSRILCDSCKRSSQRSLRFYSRCCRPARISHSPKWRNLCRMCILRVPCSSRCDSRRSIAARRTFRFVQGRSLCHTCRCCRDCRSRCRTWWDTWGGKSPPNSSRDPESSRMCRAPSRNRSHTPSDRWDRISESCERSADNLRSTLGCAITSDPTGKCEAKQETNVNKF